MHNVDLSECHTDTVFHCDNDVFSWPVLHASWTGTGCFDVVVVTEDLIHLPFLQQMASTGCCHVAMETENWSHLFMPQWFLRLLHLKTIVVTVHLISRLCLLDQRWHKVVLLTPTTLQA